MTDAELDTIEARAEAATPGPWAADGSEIKCDDYDGQHYAEWVAESYRVDDPEGSDADAAFIASARLDVPALVAEVRRLRNLVAGLVEA